MLEAILYFSLLGVAVYKIGNFFMSFFIAVRVHYWG